MLLRIVDWLEHLRLRAGGFKSRHVPTSVGPVHLVEHAAHDRGPPLVIVHGINANHMSFASVMLGLRGHFSRVVAIDLLGHGYSHRPDELRAGNLASALVESLDEVVDPARPALFLGNSLGGLSALRYARERPERIAGLLLSSPGGARESAEDLADFLGRFHMPSNSHAVEFLERLYAKTPWFTPLAAPFVRRRFMAPNIRGLIEATTPQDLAHADELAALHMPVRLLWGRHDTLMPRRHFEWYQRHLPRHADVIEDDLSHCPQLDQPRKLRQHILDWARSVTDQGA